MAENWGTYHISSDTQNYEPARSNFFTLIVKNIDGIVRADFNRDFGNPGAADKIANAQEVLKLAVNRASVPHFSIAPIEIRRGNSTVRYAGNPSFSAGSIEIQDWIGTDTKSVIMAWQAAAYDVITDKGGRAKDYKKDCVLYEYTQDYQEVRHWDLFGCWISDVTEGEFDVGADGDRKIGATLQYDRAEMHLPQ